MDSERILQKARLVEVAAGREPAPLVLKNAAYVNVFSGEICRADIALCDGVIAGVGVYSGVEERDLSGKIVCPGFIDAHIHLESSLVMPAEFARAVLPHGTTMVVTDPHEIANVMGTDGLRFMLDATRQLPVEVRFMLPSCVPATGFEEAGAVLTAEDLEPFYSDPRVIGLAEMMNAFGVIHADPSVLQKLAAAQRHDAPIDGHAPALTGQELNAYIASGVGTDHECSTYEEGLEKLRRGQYIMIREGTAARNLAALAGLLTPATGHRCVLCTDDKHPSDLLNKGHMDEILRQAVCLHGADPIVAVQAATLNAAQCFGLRRVGAVAPGYWADLTVVDSLAHFGVEEVYCKGVRCCENGHIIPFPAPQIDPNLLHLARHTFHVQPIRPEHFAAQRPLGVIGMVQGEIITENCGFAGQIDLSQDILKIAVIERHHGTGHVGIGYLKGYGLKGGAVATSISHDSHNLIVVGTSDEEMAFAANRVLAQNGGIAVTSGEQVLGEVRLGIGGLMSEEPLLAVNEALEQAKAAAHNLGVGAGIDPFMTLSFMALPVIPTLRLTTKGVVDAMTQKFI